MQHPSFKRLEVMKTTLSITLKKFNTSTLQQKPKNATPKKRVAFWFAKIRHFYKTMATVPIFVQRKWDCPL
jgi:hypothetical protein